MSRRTLVLLGLCCQCGLLCNPLQADTLGAIFESREFDPTASIPEAPELLQIRQVQSGAAWQIGPGATEDSKGNRLHYHWSCGEGRLETLASDGFHHIRYTAPVVTEETEDYLTLWVGSESGKAREWTWPITVLPGDDPVSKVVGGTVGAGLSPSMLPNPLNIQVPRSDPGSIEVTWDAYAGAVHYKVYWNTVDDYAAAVAGGQEIGAVNLNSRSAYLSGLPPDQTYYFWVEVYTPDGSFLSNAVAIVGRTVHTDSATPVAAGPQNVRTSQGEAYEKVFVGWSPIAGATHYEVERTNAPYTLTSPEGGDVTGRMALATTVETSWIDLEAKNGVRYLYWVKAVEKQADDSYLALTGWSAGASGWERDLPAPAQPANVVATAVGETVEIMWAGDALTSVYDIYRSVSPDVASARRVATVRTTEFRDRSVAAGLSYYYWIGGRNERFPNPGDGPLLLAAQVDVPETEGNDGGPAQVGAFAAMVTPSEDVSLSWSSPADGAETWVQRSAEGRPWFTLARLEDSIGTYLDETPIVGRTYHYRVMRVSAAGLRSAPVQAGPVLIEYQIPNGPPAAPESLTVVARAPDALALAFQDIAVNETSYEIERRLVGDAWQSLPTLAANHVVIYDEGRAAGTEYEYRVRAVNAWGGSAWLEGSATTSNVPTTSASARFERAECLATDPVANPGFTEVVIETGTRDNVYLAAQGQNYGGDGGSYAVHATLVGPGGRSLTRQPVPLTITGGSPYGTGSVLWQITPETEPGIWTVVFEFEDLAAEWPPHVKRVRELTVLPPEPYRPEIVTTVAPLELNIGDAVDIPLAAIYGAVFWAADVPLPAGLHLDEVTGRLSGTIQEPFDGEIRIYAINDGGASPPVKIVIDSDHEVPDAPTEIAVIQEASNGALIRWTGHSENTESFLVQTREVMDNGSVGTWSEPAQDVVGSAGFVELPPDRTYDVRVRSFNGREVSISAVVGRVVTTPLPDPMEIDLMGYPPYHHSQFGTATFDHVSFYWWERADSDVYQYRLYDRDTNELLATSGSLSAPVGELPVEAGRNYELRLTAHDTQSDGSLRVMSSVKVWFTAPKSPTHEPDISLTQVSVPSPQRRRAFPTNADEFSAQVDYTAHDTYQAVLRAYLVDSFGNLRLTMDSPRKSTGDVTKYHFLTDMPTGGGLGAWSVLVAGEDTQGRIKILGQTPMEVESQAHTLPFLDRRKITVTAGEPVRVAVPVIGGGQRFEEVGDWPDWASLELGTGVMRLEPLTVGVFPIQMQIENWVGVNGPLSLDIVVVAPPAPAIVSDGVLDLPLGESFTFRLQANGDAVSFAATGLPAGLFLDASSGWIYGAPEAVGTFNVALEVSDLWSTTTSTLVITIEGMAPTFAIEPADVLVESGGKASLRVSATGSTPMTYQWYQGLAADESMPMVGATFADFLTPDVTATTHFWVKATNPKGAVTSRSAEVRVVTEGPPIVTHQDYGLSISSPDRWLLSVSAVGEAPLSYKWHRGAAGDESVLIGTTSEPTLVLQPVQQSGQYWVKVSNTLGEDQSETFNIDYNVDYDSDGLDNNWEVVHGLDFTDSQDADLDLDGDGWTSRQEHFLNTHPRSSSSRFTVALQPPSGAAPAVRFGPVSNGRTYDILFSPTLASDSWEVLESFTAEAGDEGSYVDVVPPDTGIGFYRVQARQTAPP